MSPVGSALSLPTVRTIANDFLYGTLAYSVACFFIGQLGYTEHEAGLVLAEAILRDRAPALTADQIVPGGWAEVDTAV